MSKKQHREDKSVHVPQKAKIKTELSIREFPWSPRQREFIDIIQNKETKVIFLSGPAGSSKTLLAVYCALKALNDKKISEIIYIRNVVESTNHPIGYLRGDIAMKLQPYLEPLVAKLDEFLPKSQSQGLTANETVRGIPVGFLRGLSLNGAYIVSDETQDATKGEILTIMTRMGKHSKLLLLADEKQSDIKNSGYKTVCDAFNNEESKKHGIFVLKFGIEDIMREDSIKYILEVFEKIVSK